MTTGLNFVHNGLTQVIPQIIKQKFADFVVADFVTIDSEANPYLDSVIYLAGAQSSDLDTGLVADNTTTFNSVDIEFQKIEVPLARWRKSVGWTDIEIERAQVLGQDIDTQRVAALNKEAYQTLQKVAFIGHKQRPDITGLLNNKTVKSMAGGFGKPVNQMSYDEAVEAFSNLFMKVTEQTGNIQTPNTIAIDYGDYAALARLTKPGESSLSALAFLETTFSMIAGHGVKFKRIPGEFAKQVTKGNTRLLAYYNDGDYVRFAVPMTPQFTQPFEKDGGGVNIQVLATMAFGAVCFLEPQSAMYVDYKS